jgi:hypothetical protein
MFYSKETDYMLNYLTLRINDKEIRDALTIANSHLSHKLYKPLACMNFVTCCIYTASFIYAQGDPFLVFVNFSTLAVILLNPVIYKYRMQLCKWCSPMYLAVHTIFTPLLFANKLGALNTDDRAKY